MITLSPIKKKGTPRQYFAALGYLNGGLLINGNQTFNFLSISIIISLIKYLIPPYYILRYAGVSQQHVRGKYVCVTDVNIMLMTLTIMVLTDSIVIEIVDAMMIMVQTH